MCLEVLVTFGTDLSRDVMRPDSAEVALRKCKATGKILHAFPSLAEQ